VTRRAPGPRTSGTSIGIPVALALALGIGCAPARSATTAAVAADSTHRPRIAIGAFAPFSRETLELSPASPTPEPTANYLSLEAVRDSIGALLRRLVSPADTAIHLRREAVTFQYWYAKAKARGWAYHIEVRDTSECPQERLERALVERGWVTNYSYQADGPDGGDLGFLSRGYLCLVEAHWDGGDDSDSTYVPAAGCEVVVTCVPRRPDDVPPY
jgi:hypothetical protein